MISMIDVPAGMLRISKDGEGDRVIYPCHADRWQQQGWTVHPAVFPDSEAEDIEPPSGGGGKPPKPPKPKPPELDGELDLNLDLDGDTLTDEPDVQPEQPAPELQVLDFEAMTKAEIIAACETHYGVTLDSHMTKVELVGEAKLLAATRPLAISSDGATDEPPAEDSRPVVPDLL